MKDERKTRYLKTLMLLSGVVLIAVILHNYGPRAAASTPGGGKLAPPPFPVRAIQVLNLECDSWAQVDKRLSEFKATGAQAIILRVFQNPGDGTYKFIKPAYNTGVYFQTKNAPVVADILGPICEMARKKNLTVIAWMTSRYANYGYDQETHLRCMAWDFGAKKAVPKRGYCPLLPESQDRIAALYADLARYPVGGVLIQDDLILKHTEGMNPKARKLYKTMTGKDADPDIFYKKIVKSGKSYRVGQYTDEFHDWCVWKNEMLLLFAERLRRTVQTKRPGIPVGINMFYETLTAPHNSLSWYAQDMDKTIASDMDFYAFMLYHRQMQDELRLSRPAVFDLIDGSLTEVLKKTDNPRRVWVKIQTVDWDTGARIPNQEMGELMDRVKAHGQLGLVVVPAKKSLDLNFIKEGFN